jgi:hypothetical protein
MLQAPVFPQVYLRTKAYIFEHKIPCKAHLAGVL